MTPKQLAKQLANQKYYDANGKSCRKYAREYYYANREKLLAQKKAKRCGL
jgi:hypothetical protein